ncbi:MAG TPA: FecR domain-containing protein [Puia sp.]|nr:FecR domain-containing protein [Puia sp.]
MSLQEAKQFVAHFIAGDYAPGEYATFLRWLKGATAEELNAIADEHESLHEHWSLSATTPSPEWMARLEEKLNKVDEPIWEAPVKRIDPNRFTRKKVWMAAASVVILITTGTYWFNQVAGVKPRGVQHRTEALTNSFSIPRGGEQKQIVLADGSKVWLNAASTLKYPAFFSGGERVVQLSGEAFFEVGKSSEKPFRVLIKGAEVEALGTEFNVKAYEDEAFSRTTLLEGIVKVASASQNATLKPGEQAEVTYSEPGVSVPIRVTGGVNADVVLAWKDGFIQFRNEDLSKVMREIGRCYNVDIQYEPNIPEKKISGSFSRKDGLPKILEQLSNLDIHFTNDGKTVKVLH